MSLGALQDLTLSLGGGPGVMVAGKPTGCGIPGRPLREDGRLSLTEADGPRDAGLAEDWLEQARGEHAAVASFLRLSLELEALGAPLDLVERCRHAAAQEAIHAGLCAQRAADHSGATVVLGELITAPRAFETRGEGLRVVGVESWVDGFVNEGWAAVVAWRKALQVSDARDRQIHLRIAHEELQHARLGGDLASWCMAELQKPARAPHGQASKSSLLSGA